MSRKRFEKIETSKPEKPEKKSFLDKFKFKRKLEIDGIGREELPTKSSSAPIQKQDLSKLKTKETKAELDSLVQEIDIAEQNKLARQAQQKIDLEKKRAELDRKIQMDIAREKAQEAKSKLFWGIIAIAIAVFILYQLSKTNLSARGSSDIIFFIFTIVAAILGRRRGGWW